MPKKPLIAFSIEAPVQQDPFDLCRVIVEALEASDERLLDGDVLALSSKYVAISEGRVVNLDDVHISTEALELAEHYQLNPKIAQLILQEADHIFGGIPGFLLTYNDGIVSPNAGLDRSNIPSGYAVLFPEKPYQSAARIQREMQERLGVRIGVILTDSWLMPGRLGTTGVALATAGFKPIQDERGKMDLFGKPMAVTQRGVADQICSAAQLVMGERDEATPIAVVRNAGIELSDGELSVADVAIPWDMCLYIESLTNGLLAHPNDTLKYNQQINKLVPGD